MNAMRDPSGDKTGNTSFDGSNVEPFRGTARENELPQIQSRGSGIGLIVDDAGRIGR